MSTERSLQSSASELVKDVAAEAKTLITGEIALAQNDLNHTLEASKRGATAIAAGAVAAVAGLQLLLFSFAFATRARPMRAAYVGLGLLGAAGVAVAAGVAALPKRPMGETRDRLVTDIKEIQKDLQARLV